MPYCHKNDSIFDSCLQDTKFCLKQNEEGTLHLDCYHAYYFQVQTQIYVVSLSIATLWFVHSQMIRKCQ